MTTAQLAPNTFTLRPANPNDPGPFLIFHGDINLDGMTAEDFAQARRMLILQPVEPGEITLTDEWAFHFTHDGPAVWVRRADCGSGCRCAGEYRVAA